MAFTLADLEIDFTSGSDYNYKLRGKQELIARAVGVHLGLTQILDLTAGLCEDAWTLARLGCSVEAVEGNKDLFEVLSSAHQKSLADEKSAPVANRLRLTHQMASQRLKVLAKASPADLPEVIYLDPMFPQEGKSALPKKRMQILRSLELESESLEVLIPEALRWAKNRVVLKRGLKDPVIWRTPQAQVKGKSVRFDVYLSAAAKKSDAG